MRSRLLVMALAAATPAWGVAGPETPQPAPVAGGAPLPSANPAAPLLSTNPYTSPPAAGACTPACDPCASCVPGCTSCLCGPPGRLWVSAEWLYWATSGNHLPPLATVSPAGTAQPIAGVLGAGPNTLVLFGDRNYDGEMRSGFRTQAVYWLDECQRCGVYGDFFFLGRAQSHFAAGEPGAVVGRPFTNALTGLPDAELVTFPGVLAGGVAADTYTDVIGGGAGVIKNLCCDPCGGRLDLTLGYRYLRVTDDLTVYENLSAREGSAAPPGTAFQIRDHFRARNHFHGVNVGLSGERRVDRLFVQGWASVALGVSHQVLTVDGSTVVTGPAGNVVTAGPGGLLTQPSNIGEYERNRFAVLPEAGVRVGYQVTDRLRAYVGYTFLYVSRVTRTGDMIDTRVNPNQFVPAVPPVAGPALPAFDPPTRGFWAQGVSVGVQFLF
jgi:hypothetical protein